MPAAVGLQLGAPFRAPEPYRELLGGLGSDLKGGAGDDPEIAQITWQTSHVANFHPAACRGSARAVRPAPPSKNDAST